MKKTGSRKKMKVVVPLKKRRIGDPLLPKTKVKAQFETAEPVRGGVRLGSQIPRTRRRKIGAEDREPVPGPSQPKRRRQCQIDNNESTPKHTANPSKRVLRAGSKRRQTAEEKLQNEVNELLCTFGDCDPEHLKTKLTLLADDPDRSEIIYKDLLARDYPTLKERLRRKHDEELEAKLLHSDPTIDDLIKRYSDVDGREQEKRRRKEDKAFDVYRDHAVSFLSNRFLYLPVGYVRRIFIKHCDVISAYEQLQGENEKRKQSPRAPGRRGTYLIKPRDAPMPAPSDVCPYFRWDSLYIERKMEIQDYLERQEAVKTLRFMKAKSAGELEECPVCLDTLLEEDMQACHNNHSYCKNCIHLTVKQQIGHGLSIFTCLMPDCDQELDLHILYNAMPASLYKKVESRVQEDQVRRAGLSGLAACPSCSYAVVFPEDSNRAVLQCENPYCLFTSCRFCKEDAHPPFTCEERAMAKVRMRQYIENKMAEAVIRKCVSCKRRFVKSGGCNRMVCPNCQTAMCYACGKRLDTGYHHFTDNSDRCKILDERVIHQEDIEKVIPKAETDFKKANREADGMSLDFDPLEDWKSAPEPVVRPQPQPIAQFQLPAGEWDVDDPY